MNAKVRFHGRLNFFISKKKREQWLPYTFKDKVTIKDALESLGPPHPEFELVTMNGRGVTWTDFVEDGAEIEGYAERSPDFSDASLLYPPYQGRMRFILDTHLGRLAAYLRMMGYDTLYENDFPDDVIAQIANDEQRIVLTRDIGVLKRSLVTYGYYVRETNPEKRLHELNERYSLKADMKPFTLCMVCNHPIHPVAKEDIIDKIPPDSAQYYDQFHQCESCARIFWRGSHHERMQGLIDSLA